MLMITTLTLALASANGDPSGTNEEPTTTKPSAVVTGCMKDTDCKGSRICVSSACVFPGADPEHFAPSSHLERPEFLVAKANSRATGAFWSAPFSLASGVAAAIIAALFRSYDIGDEHWAALYVPLGISLAASAAAAGLGGHANSIATSGLTMLNHPPVADGLSIGGWLAWGAGVVSLIVPMVATAVVRDDIKYASPFAVGGPAVLGSLLTTTGGILLGVAARQSAAALEQPIPDTATSAPTAKAPPVALAPLLSPNSAGLQLATVF